MDADVRRLQEDVAELKAAILKGPLTMLWEIRKLEQKHAELQNQYEEQCNKTREVEEALQNLQREHKELKDSGVMLLDEIDKKKEEIEDLKRTIQEREDTIRTQSKKIGEQHKEILKLVQWQKTFRNLMRDQAPEEEEYPDYSDVSERSEKSHEDIFDQ